MLYINLNNDQSQSNLLIYQRQQFIMENKQLERDLRTTIQSLKLPQLTRIMTFISQRTQSTLASSFKKKGINFVACELKFDTFQTTGFGRNEDQAMVNSIKNLLDTFVGQNHEVELLKIAFKHCHEDIAIQSKKKQEKVNIQHFQANKHEDTLDLETAETQMNEIHITKELFDISHIGQTDSKKSEGCNCVYFDVHQHHITQIKNLQARMKLISKQNQMLKQLLLKDYKNDSVIFKKKDPKQQRPNRNQESKQNQYINSNMI